MQIILVLSIFIFPSIAALEWNVLDPMALRSPKEWRVPDPPQNVRVESSTRESITLAWNAPSSADEIMVRGYTLSYGIESSTQKIVIEGTETRSFTVSGLKPNTTYVFALTAYNEADGEDSERVLITATTRSELNQTDELAPPNSLQIKSTGIFNEILLKWIDPNNYSNMCLPNKLLDENDKMHDYKYNKQIFYLVEYFWIDTEKSRNFTQSLTSDKMEALISISGPYGTYEFRVRTICAKYGKQSAWSLPLRIDANEFQDRRHIDKNENSKSSKTNRRLEMCDFEMPSICDFINDPNATLLWRHAIMPLRQGGTGKHSIVLEYPQKTNSQIDNEISSQRFAFARLLSPVYDLKKSERICVSFIYDIHPKSYVSILHEADDWADAILLMRKSFNKNISRISSRQKIKKNSLHNNNYYYHDTQKTWRKVSLETSAKSRRGFQIIFEGMRETMDAVFRVAIDDLKVAARRCFSSERQPPGFIDEHSFIIRNVERCYEWHS